MSFKNSNNVLRDPLVPCSFDPITGYFRDGCCETGPTDAGRHIVCAVMTDAFLKFSQAIGNDLSTPRPEYRFVGLRAGDKWCLCLERWRQAHAAGAAPKVILESTHEIALERVPLEVLREFAIER